MNTYSSSKTISTKDITPNDLRTSTVIEPDTHFHIVNFSVSIVSFLSILLLIIGPIFVVIYSIKSKKSVRRKILFGTIIIGLPILLFLITTILQVFINI